MHQCFASPTITHTVLVIDSGVGGISIVQALQSKMLSVQIIYVADNAMFPYGEKPQQLIMQRLQQIIDVAIQEYAIDAVVIGCNTATVMHIDQLRQYYSPQGLPFIGVVPPVKTAAQTTQSRCFTVLATENTAQSPYLKRLINNYAAHCNVQIVGAVGLADYAESKIHGISVEKGELQHILSPILNHQINQTDVLVLGCTHYAFMQTEIAALLPANINIIEPSLPVANRIQWILERQNPSDTENKVDKKRKNQFFFTQKQEISDGFRQFLAIHGFQNAQVLLPVMERTTRAGLTTI